MLYPEFVEKFPKTMAFLERFEALPKIKEYMESPRFIKGPANGASAKWNLDVDGNAVSASEIIEQKS